MERIFYKPVMKSGSDQFQIYIPKDAVDALGIEDRDELKVVISKTDRKIKKRKNGFGKDTKDVVETFAENELFNEVKR